MIEKVTVQNFTVESYFSVALICHKISTKSFGQSIPLGTELLQYFVVY